MPDASHMLQRLPSESRAAHRAFLEWLALPVPRGAPVRLDTPRNWTEHANTYDAWQAAPTPPHAGLLEVAQREIEKLRRAVVGRRGSALSVPDLLRVLAWLRDPMVKEPLQKRELDLSDLAPHELRAALKVATRKERG